ncbi:MAG: TonB-dependent receptor [Bacteroidetes bacterium]|nr:MAG: TonB-dependent receptor [Bacteroidota bacterium]
MKLKQLTLVLVMLLGVTALRAQSATVRGFVYEDETGEPVLYQKVKVVSSRTGNIYGAVTDVNGFFSVPKLAVGQYELRIESSGYDTITKGVKIERDNQIIDVKFNLKKAKSIVDLGEVEVSAEAKRKRNQVNMSKIKLDKKGLERIPSVGAENDVIGAFSVTPGVVTTGDQGGQLYVRGGTPIQNKILLDGMTIYTPFHSIGFFSIFETELVKNVDIYTGGFDSKYGGRISSVMDITYRDGNRKKNGGKVSVSPFLAKLVLEGPIGKRKDGKPSTASYVFSSKHSLLDYTSKPLYPNVNNGDGMPFSFTDLYGKLTFNADGGSKFSAFGFSNRDQVNYVNLADLNWTQSGGGMNFVLIPAGSPVFIRGHLNMSKYALSFLEQNAPERTSSIGGAELGFDFTYFQKNEGQLDLGLNINGFNTKYLTYNEAENKIEDNNFNIEMGGYLNYKVIKGRFVIQPGFRVQAYPSQSAVSAEPRFGMKYNASDKLRFKLSGGRYSQNFTSASSDRDIVNLFNGLLSAPTNFQESFVDRNGNVRDVRNALQYSWHAIVGMELDITKYWSLNLEAYQKWFTQLSNLNQNKIYDDVAEFSDIDDIYKKDFIIETGQSMGVDLLLKYSRNRWFIWGVYSLGYSDRWDGLNAYFPVFDRRHNVNMVTTYLFGKKKTLEVSLRWNLGSGLPFTPTAGGFQSEDFSDGISTNINTSNSSNVSLVLGDFNSQRLPYYHRMDLTVKKNFQFKNKTNLELIASVTNLYDRKNIFYKNRVTNEEIYQFPFLPSIGISYKF